jgi:heme exporter protein B
MELQAEGLTCSRGGREVFRNVSFKVPAGEALIVTGRNGAGKSSLLRMIAGLVRIAAGRLLLNGGTADTLIAEQAHYIGHQDAMKPSLTVAENLQFWIRFLGSRSDIRPALALLDLAPLADLPAAYLSAGQRRRLSIARIVAVSTNIRARCAVAEPALGHHARPPRRRRNHCRRRARSDRSRARARAQAWCGMNPLAAILVRDMRLAVRVGGGAFMGALFFLIVITMTPFAIGPDLALLARIGPAILWLGALLASLLALDRLFATDHDDGSLDLLMMSEVPLELTVAVKALAHWLTTGLPLVVVAPLLGLMLNVDMHALGWLTLTLAAGTPALTFIGLIGAALSVALRRGGLLLAVLVLPLTVPVLIFGVAAANAAIAGPTPFGPAFTILCALSFASLVLGPIAATAALRHGLE